MEESYLVDTSLNNDFPEWMNEDNNLQELNKILEMCNSIKNMDTFIKETKTEESND